MGTFRIDMTLQFPVEPSARGGTERKSFCVCEHECSEDDAARIAKRFRAMHPELEKLTSITWTGPRKL